jgi:CHAD domain-containing protein
LQEVTRLCTDRTAVKLCDQAATPVAEVVDDVVTVYQGHRRTGEFREVEVELLGNDQEHSDLLHAAVDTLVAAGCRAKSPVPKLVRALGAAATAPSDLEPPALGRKPTVVRLIQHTLAKSVARMVHHDAGVRLGDDPEEVHQFRVATRRLRSDLQTFASVLNADWGSGLRAELRWLGGEVGGVRDNDVLTERLRCQMTSLPEEDAEAAAGLLQLLTGRGQQVRASMLDALRTPRYDALLDALLTAAKHPVFADDTGQSAEVFGAEVVRRQWKRLQRGVRALSDPPSDAELHRIRILAKRCRYAAEMTIPVIGRRAGRFAAAIADLQTVLGDHHDAAVAEQWLREAAVAVPASAVAAGELIAIQRAERARFRRAWRAVWRSASDSKLRDWF